MFTSLSPIIKWIHNLLIVSFFFIKMDLPKSVSDLDLFPVVIQKEFLCECETELGNYGTVVPRLTDVNRNPAQKDEVSLTKVTKLI